jgi:O-antigen/teichoic acid export membrane protein
MADNESVGYYSSALKLVKLIIAVLGAISVAMFPSMINLFHNGEKEKFNELVKKCFYVLVSLSLPLVVIVAGASNEIVNVLFGEKFTRAILPMQITAPLIFIVSMSGIFGFQVLSALAKDKSILISAVIGMLVSIILSLLLVPMFKENGEAVTILLTELSVSLAFAYFSSKFFSLKGYSKIIFQQLIALIPYVVIILSAKLFIVSLIVRLFIIALFSLAWFIVYHFVIKADGIFKAQLSNILLKYKG